MKAWITFILAHWWSHHLMVFPEDDNNFRRLDLLGRNQLYPSPQLLTYEMRRVVLQHPSSLLCTTLPWLRNRRTKLPREKSQKWRQMGLFSFRLIFFQAFFPHSNEKLASTGWTSFMLLYSGHFHETNEFGLSPVFVSIIMINMYCLAEFACSTFSERSYVKI